MRTLVALLFSLLATLTAFGQQQKTFELRGDVLGETLAAFKEHHPHVQCSRYDDVTVSCSDRDGSFAGHSPYICEKEPCVLDGLSAEFYRGRLKWLYYDVQREDSGGDPFELLSKKYGKPGDHYDDGLVLNATWTSKGQRIFLQIVKDQQIGRPGISVTLEYVKDPAKGDI
jgi:hypothetical protein